QHARRICVLVVEVRGAHVVGRHQARERGLLLRSVVAYGIDVIRLAAGGGLRLGARVCGQRALRVAPDTVWVREGGPEVVVRVGLQVEHATGEHVRGDVRERAERA